MSELVVAIFITDGRDVNVVFSLMVSAFSQINGKVTLWSKE